MPREMNIVRSRVYATSIVFRTSVFTALTLTSDRYSPPCRPGALKDSVGLVLYYNETHLIRNLTAK